MFSKKSNRARGKDFKQKRNFNHGNNEQRTYFHYKKSQEI